MEKAETYMAFKIADYLSKYWFPFLVPIGWFGNTLSFLVMTKPNNRNMSTCIYMAGISVNDNVMMCLALHHWLVSGIRIHDWVQVECEIIAFLVLITLQNTTYQVLAMTMDKYIAIKWPHKAATYSTPKRAKITVVGIYICSVTYNIPNIFMSNLIGNECLAYVTGGVIAKVYSWLTFVVNAVIPFALLIYMNTVIIQKVRHSRKKFGNKDSFVDNKGHGENTANQRRQKSMKNAENQLTKMLLLVTTLFLILMIPGYFRFLYLSFVMMNTPSGYADLKLLFHITHKLYNTNNGINFFLYCISGQKFRNDLKGILCCGGGLVNSDNSKNKSQSHLTVFSMS